MRNAIQMRRPRRLGWLGSAGVAGCVALAAAGGGGVQPVQATCPTQTATAEAAVCGVTYGGTIQLCYTSDVETWWSQEAVTLGSPLTCNPNPVIDQTSNPFQMTTGCMLDQIENDNGPPAGLSTLPCTDVTNQVNYVGPTQEAVQQCPYQNTQQIQVTQSPDQVVTSSAGASTSCDYQ